MTDPNIAIAVKGYPRLSETFIAQEILGLQERGLNQLIVSLRHPTDPATHDLHDEIKAPVLYLPEYLKDDPPRVRQGMTWAKRQTSYKAARTAFEADYTRDKTANRQRRWGQACVLAAELPSTIRHIHSHYLHTPASVVRYAAMLRGLPWSFSAHAKDIWTSAKWDLETKLADCTWGVTCTGVNLDYLRGLSPRPDTIEKVYHGLDMRRFPAPPARVPSEPVTFVSIGRLVEKKGYDDLLRALARLPQDLDWRFVHIGGGELKHKLADLAKRRGLSDRIDWQGAKSRKEVFAALQAADIFVLPSRIARSGDRDGIPNVLMEAMAFGLPCVSTRVSAIPELVLDGETGLLVPQRHPAALAEALTRLARDPAMRARFGKAGRFRIEADFDACPGLDRVAELLEQDAEPQRRAG
ncbi:MAG: glycosyltransferase family 4 protein [Pseudomonadota bacterium]